MSSSTEVTRASAPVPALAPTPATTITAEDIAVPKLYIGQGLSAAVQNGLARPGDIFLASAADDEEPNVLWQSGSKEPGVLFHVLHLRKGKSYSEGDGAPLQIWDFDDPDAHEKAWTTYKYTLILPEVNPEMPATLLLTKSGKATAQKINTVVARSAAAGPMYQLAFRLTTAKRENAKGKYAVAQIAVVEPNPDHVGHAAALFEQLRPGFEQQAQPRPAQPAI